MMLMGRTCNKKKEKKSYSFSLKLRTKIFLKFCLFEFPSHSITFLYFTKRGIERQRERKTCKKRTQDMQRTKEEKAKDSGQLFLCFIAFCNFNLSQLHSICWGWQKPLLFFFFPKCSRVYKVILEVAVMFYSFLDTVFHVHLYC